MYKDMKNTEPKKVRLLVTVSEEVAKQFRILAATAGVTQSQLFESLVNRGKGNK